MYLATASATFDSTGTAVATVGPDRASESWHVTNMVTNSNSSSQTKLDVFRYNPSGTRLDHSDRANNDVSPSDFEVPKGQKIAFKWVNGTPGSSASCTIEGERHGI